MSVESVALSTTHSFAKTPTSYIYLLKHQGVQSDVHCSLTPQPTNLRQIHLIDTSLFNTLSRPSKSRPDLPTFQLSPGSLGENITTTSIDLFSLPLDTKLHFENADGTGAVVKITGLREPRKRLNEWPEGLLERCEKRDRKGRVHRRVGVMGSVVREGYVMKGYGVRIERPKVEKGLGGV